MSVIQRIRDKAAWLVISAIALSMIGFIVTDAFRGGGGGGLFNSRNTVYGRVDGTKIDYVDFEKKARLQEEQYQQAGYPMSDAMRQNIKDNLWNQEVEEILLQEQLDKLGIDVSDKELGDILYGQNPPQDLKQAFTDPQTGQYDATRAYQQIQALKKQKNNPQAQSFFETYLPSLVKNRAREKYLALLTNSVYVPKWMAEKAVAENSQVASISYVNIPYSTIADSTILISDDEVKDYVKQHAKEYKQEKSRAISYVLFSASPSVEDTNAIRSQLENLRTEFDSTSDYEPFLIRNGSETNFFDGYVVKKNMQMPNADSIAALPDGKVLGPYLDGGSYVLAKMIAKRTVPDSVKVRHILISTQNGTPDSVAKRRIDSVQSVVNSDSSWKKVAAAVSEDPGSKDKGGEYEFASMQMQTLAKEFADEAFYGKKGDKKIIKTSFGYHLIEVLDQKSMQPAYKVAYLSRPILASTETDNAASGRANQFSGQSRSEKSFFDNANKMGLKPATAPEIKPYESTVPGIGNNRQFVKWINEAKKGEVSDAFRVDDNYVVAVVTEINEEGLMNTTKARPMVENLIRRHKKAEQISKKIGNPSSLDAVATMYSTSVQHADSVNFSQGAIPNVGQEFKVAGAAFNKQWLNKITPAIEGNTGVFVIKPENVFAVSNGSMNVEETRNNMATQRRSTAYRATEALKAAAKIKDYRGDF